MSGSLCSPRSGDLRWTCQFSEHVQSQHPDFGRPRCFGWWNKDVFRWKRSCRRARRARLSSPYHVAPCCTLHSYTWLYHNPSVHSSLWNWWVWRELPVLTHFLDFVWLGQSGQRQAFFLGASTINQLRFATLLRIEHLLLKWQWTIRWNWQLPVAHSPYVDRKILFFLPPNF